MKTLRRLAVLFALIPCSVFGQTCFGDFAWSSGGGLTVNFNATVSLNVTSINWTFGDANTAMNTGTYVSHTYATPGTYNVCILVYDATMTCFDSACHTVVVDSCFGTLNYTVNGQTVTFTGSSSQPTGSTVYLWNFGDNNFGAGQSATHTYASPGTYTACFAFYDTTNNCDDSLCVQVTVGGGCTADFMWIDSLGYCFFINQSSPGQSGYYMWDFGDGNFSSQYSPSHQYAGPGTYTVCLVAMDSNQVPCDSICHTVNITSVSVNELDAGIAFFTLAPNPAEDFCSVSFTLARPGDVFVSLFDISGRSISGLSRAQLDAGRQTIELDTKNLSPGTYIVRVTAGGHSVNTRMVVSRAR